MTRFIDPAPVNTPNGKFFFFKSETAIDLDTFSDSLMTPALKNTNPVIIPSSGITPNIFFEGSAKVVKKDANDEQIYERDPVGAENVTGDFALFNPLIIYEINDIVEGTDGKFYISLSAANSGNDPVAPSPSNWSEIRFIVVYNASESYDIGDVVQEADGLMWRSLTNGNLGNTPNSDDGTNWQVSIDITNILIATNTVIPQLGGGTLTALRINELQDGSTYTLPLANSVLVNQTITIDLPSKFSASSPIVNRSGGDTISDIDGTDTSINFIGATEIRLTSDGVSEWRL